MKFGKWKRIIAGMMTAVMIATSAPSDAYAAEESGVGNVTEEVLSEGIEEIVIETEETIFEEQAVEEKAEKEWEESEKGQTEIGVERESLIEDETSTFNDSEEIETVTERITSEEAMEDLTKESETELETETETETDNAHADNGDYPYSVAAGVYVADKWGFYQCECTSFVAYCLNNRNGFSFWNTMYGSDNTNRWGNANHWGSVARLHGFSVDNNPAVGAVAWSGSGDTGHVAWVCAVNGDQITIDEYNYAFVKINGEWHGNHLYRTRTVHKSSFQYIHLKDIASEPIGTDLPNGGSQTIMSGDYYIMTAVDDKKCLTIDHQSNEDGRNAQIYTGVGNPAWIFNVTWLGSDKGYKIIFKSSGKSLTVDGASDEDKRRRGQNVDQWEWYGNMAQMWVIDEVDSGAFYTIRSRRGGFYMDVENGSATDGANVRMWEGNGSNAEKWRFIPAGTQTVSNGDYYIVTEVDNNKCLNAENTNIQINSKIGQESAVFTLTYLENGFYKIIHKQTGKSLDVYTAAAKRGTNVQLYDHHGGLGQQWAIRKASDGIYYIQPRCSGHFLDVANAETKEGTNVWTTVWMGGANAQKWKFIPYQKPKLQPPAATLSNNTEVEAGTKFYLNTNGADEIYFTWDKSEPTRSSLKYSNFKNTGLQIPAQGTSCTLKAFAVKEGYEDSDTVTYTYKIKPKETEPESSENEESEKTEESSKTEETGGTEESPATPEDDDPQDGVKWHYSEQKVTYKDLSMHGEIATAIKPKIYDGTPYKPAIKVTTTENNKKITLTEGPDYRVLYFNNIHAGTATVTVRGNGIYKGTISRKFKIKKKPCKQLKVIAGSMPTNSTAAPKVYVYDGATLLKENKDYTLDGITKNLTATKGKKQFYVIAAPDSDYEGTTTARLTVYDAANTRIQGTIDTPNAVKLSQSTYPYTGTACKPTAVVTINGKILTAGKDYTITYQNNKQTGTAFAIITGKGAYAGSVVKEFTIKPSDGEFTLKKPIATPTYNGRLQKPKITVMANGKTLKPNKDYTITYTNNLHATDRAKVTVRGKGNYKSIPTKTFYFTINPCQIKKATVKGAKGSLTITYAKHTLVEGVDYDLIYGETAVKNKITVTIKAKEGGSFTGEVSKKVNNK